MKSKLEWGLMGASLVASIIGMALIISFTFRFIAKEWNTLTTFITNIF